MVSWWAWQRDYGSSYYIAPRALMRFALVTIKDRPSPALRIQYISGLFVHHL